MYIKCKTNVYTPRKINGWNLRMHPRKSKIIFQAIIFSFYVNLPGCIYIYIYKFVEIQRPWILGSKEWVPQRVAAHGVLFRLRDRWEAADLLVGKQYTHMCWGLNSHFFHINPIIGVSASYYVCTSYKWSYGAPHTWPETSFFFFTAISGVMSLQ